ncbi:MAG: hypothetical protein IJU39_02530 [Clostridia bacterium]|nr:hypothetical protein [Clostridia bacterium]
MYFFKPIALSEEKKNINGVFECAFKYDGYDSDDFSGGCEGVIEGNYVIVTKIAFPADKPDFCEGLLRAALNYGANRGAYMARCCCLNAIDSMEMMGFEEVEPGCFEGDIPTLLGGSCGRCAK